MERNIKLPEDVYRELKVFTAMNNEKMTTFAGLAIMNALKERGHKFLFSKSKTKK